MTILEQVVEQAAAQSVLEVVAVISAIAYLFFAIRQQIICWLCAAVSTAIYVWIFISAKLYMESVLNSFYFGMAIYGYFMWRSGDSNGEGRSVVVWPLTTHVRAVLAICMLSSANGYLLTQFSDAAFPYVDSLTTWSAIWATFLVARKVLENWWYWLAIDFASVFIYFSRGLELSSALFVVYIVMIPFGLVAWTRSLRKQRALG